MFKQNANTMFNNNLFKCGMISPMHEQMKRLYEAAKFLKDVTGQSAIASLLNESPQTLNNWERRGMSKNGMFRAEEVIGCRARWLKDGSGDMTDDGTITTPAPRDEYTIPQYIGRGGAMGGGLVLRDQPGEIHAWRVTPDWIVKNVKAHTGTQNLCVVTGFGDSMRPLYNPGDPLIMDKGVTSVEFDGIYFFRIGDEGFIKRLQRIPGEGLVAISQNKEYRDWVIKPDMDFEVFGRIVKAWCGSDF